MDDFVKISMNIKISLKIWIWSLETVTQIAGLADAFFTPLVHCEKGYLCHNTLDLHIEISMTFKLQRKSPFLAYVMALPILSLPLQSI